MRDQRYGKYGVVRPLKLSPKYFVLALAVLLLIAIGVTITTTTKKPEIKRSAVIVDGTLGKHISKRLAPIFEERDWFVTDLETFDPLRTVVEDGKPYNAPDLVLIGDTSNFIFKRYWTVPEEGLLSGVDVIFYLKGVMGFKRYGAYVYSERGQAPVTKFRGYQAVDFWIEEEALKTRAGLLVQEIVRNIETGSKPPNIFPFR